MLLPAANILEEFVYRFTYSDNTVTMTSSKGGSVAVTLSQPSQVHPSLLLSCPFQIHAKVLPAC